MDITSHTAIHMQTNPRCDEVASSDTLSSPAFNPRSSFQSSQGLPTVKTTPLQSTYASLPMMPLRPPSNSKRCISRVHFDLHMSIRQDTCMDIKATKMTESSLWTLPGSDDYETESEIASTTTPPKAANRWSHLLQRAASSNRERYRARLEGDGWSFVGGRYSDDMQELSDESSESVDEEFDVVVLSKESDGC